MGIKKAYLKNEIESTHRRIRIGLGRSRGERGKKVGGVNGQMGKGGQKKEKPCRGWTREYF